MLFKNMRELRAAYVLGARSSAGHWYLRPGAPKILYVPGLAERHTVKRVLYALDVGDIAENFELRATCSSELCIRPEHQQQVPARTNTRPLSMRPEDLFRNIAGTYRRQESRLPLGVTIGTWEYVKMLGREGKLLREISQLARLPMETVVMIRNGVYDKAVENARDGGKSGGRPSVYAKSIGEEAVFGEAPSPKQWVDIDGEPDLRPTSELPSRRQRPSATVLDESMTTQDVAQAAVLRSESQDEILMEEPRRRTDEDYAREQEQLGITDEEAAWLRSVS